MEMRLYRSILSVWSLKAKIAEVYKRFYGGRAEERGVFMDRRGLALRAANRILSG